MRISPQLVVAILTLGLCLLGLLFVFEASTAEALAIADNPYFFVTQQAVRLAIGVVALIGVQLVPIGLWQKTAGLWYGLSILLLLLVIIPGIGLELNGAHRWLNVGGFLLQPVEIAKFSVILFFASWMVKHQRLGPFLFLTMMPALLVIKQPDLGSLLVLLCIAFGIYFVAGGKMTSIIGIGFLGIVLLSLAIVSSPYRMKRVTTFLNPDSDPLGASFHIRQITLALGNGGWWGQGLGNSRQKYSYIPEASTDSIFAIIAEEVGFFGSLALITLMGSYIYACFNLVKQIKDDPFRYLVAVGIVIWISSQVVLNLAAVVALVPLTGVPLPFFSYGGSSLIMLLIGVGVLIKCSIQPSSVKKR
ncbi:MAG TPA: putative peptidoglycan glycosyltransferase FtsW [Vitreimonas sp.]|nr:putative peptidoglycan glycosyltransferase FtsW [Vitreimonas sp.]